MCMALYAAADTPLPEIPPVGPPAPPAPLTVRALERDERAVRARFTKPYVYFLGADTGCSCGFSYDAPEDPPAESRASNRQLRRYLAAAVAQVGPVELYACWGGDEADPPDAQVRITPAYFVDDLDVFELPERWLATVVADAS